MAAGKHIGKVLIKIREKTEDPSKLVMAIPRFYCLEDRSYVILGGLGGFGLELGNCYLFIFNHTYFFRK